MSVPASGACGFGIVLVSGGGVGSVVGITDGMILLVSVVRVSTTSATIAGLVGGITAD